MKRDPIREARICRLYCTGHSLQDIGTIYGISRERVRQIVLQAFRTNPDGATEPPKPARPDAICAYHWPRCVPADFWDAEGKACCNGCGQNRNRVCRMPKFAMREAH